MGASELIHKLWNSCAELLYPRFCFGCRTRGSYICERCRALPDAQTYRLSTGMTVFAAHSYRHAGIQCAIKQLKYRGGSDIAFALADIIASAIRPHLKVLLPSAEIVAVPSTARHRRERGVNQSELLGRALAKILEMPFSDALVKIRETPPQSTLGRAERLKNLRGAFRARQNYTPRSCVIIVDDVSTTGATLMETARVLKIAGAAEIFGAVVAHG